MLSPTIEPAVRPGTPPARRFRPARLVALGLAALAGCAPLPATRPVASPGTGFRYEHPARDATGAALDVRIDDRAIVRAPSGRDVMRVDFSFVSYDGYLGPEDLHRSTGALFLALDEEEQPRLRGAPVVLVTEYPPGTSRSAFPFFAEYGERPPDEIGIAAAVVDVRGPVVSGLREFVNPDDPAGGAFRSEAQFAYSMLRSYEESGETDLLWEERAAGAWIRAVSAVTAVVRTETGESRPAVLLTGQGRGALAAAQAAARDERVSGVVAAAWPLDWMDYHFVRWRRWERRSSHDPLAALAPSPWGDSREVLSFLTSSYGNPDPGCPACVGSGQGWRRQYDLATLRSEGNLDVALFLLEGDADPDVPVDLLARASAPLDEVESVPGPGSDFAGPFASFRPVPFDDLRVLRGSDGSLASDAAAATVRAWGQHLAGYRDVPLIRAEEYVAGGDLVVTVSVAEGNAPVIDVSLRTLEAGALHPFDFKAPLHRRRPEPMPWRDVPVLFDGHAPDFTGRWVGRFPLLPGVNQAYLVLVRTRVGDAVTEHALPVRPIWHGGDPALGPARP